jgi:hypothetical protein
VTTKDKTGDQLMASIRKTKTGATAVAGEDKAAAPQAPAPPKTSGTTKATAKPAAGGAKPKAARPATRKQAAAKAATKAAPAKADTGQAGYQAGRRVWPD